MRTFVLCVVLVAGVPALGQTPVINEYMSANATVIADDDGDYSDWIELYNPSVFAYSLVGCYLSDDADEPLKWRFPAGLIRGRSYLLVWASDKNRVSEGGELHTNFKIASEGEPLIFTAANGVTRLDLAPAAVLATDRSYGRLPDGAASWVHFASPTPAGPNAEGDPLVPAPKFSAEPGLYAASVVLAIADDDPQALITYTLDGSEPAESSPRYTAPLMLTDRRGAPAVLALIPTNFVQGTHASWRPPRGEIQKLNVVRARAFRAGCAPSAVATGSYLVSDHLATDCPLDVVSVVTPAPNLFADDIGIYVPGDTYAEGWVLTGNYFQEGDAWERPGHLELFSGRETLISQDVGLRIHGGWTRYYPQKSLRIYARSAYGESAFAYPLFPDLPYTSYQRFLLRNAGDDWGLCGFKEAAIHVIIGPLGLETMSSRLATHFINGEYWGITDIRERIDRYYINRRFGVPEDDVVILENNATIDEGVSGDNTGYLALRNYVLTADMTSPASLEWVRQRMDIENYLTYVTAEIYCRNTDWPENNTRYWRRRLAQNDLQAPPGHDGRWRWIFYDADSGFSTVETNTLVRSTDPAGPNGENPWSTQLLRGLLRSPTFANAFINSFADHMNSTFMPARVIAIVDTFATACAPAIPAYYNRWDVTQNWAVQVQQLRHFATNRPAIQRQHLIDYFHLVGTADVRVDVSVGFAGKVQVNALVIDENLPGLPDPADPYPWTGIYFRGVPVTITAVANPGYRFLRWREDDDPQPSRVVLPGTTPAVLTAVFGRDAPDRQLVHYWHFNALPSGTLASVPSDLSLVGGPAITYAGTGNGYLDRVTGTALNAIPAQPAGYGLRVRNPSHLRQLLIPLPMSGYREPILSLAGWRSTNGAQDVWLEYSLDAAGIRWTSLSAVRHPAEEPVVMTWDFAGIVGVANNPEFRVRLRFGGTNASGDEGNTRWDNLRLEARAGVEVDVPAPSATSAILSLSSYPNPFNPATIVTYAVTTGEPHVLDVFDVRGRRVRVLARGEGHGEGPRQVTWDGRDDDGRLVPSGSYVLRLNAGGRALARVIQLVR